MSVAQTVREALEFLSGETVNAVLFSTRTPVAAKAAVIRRIREVGGMRIIDLSETGEDDTGADGCIGAPGSSPNDLVGRDQSATLGAVTQQARFRGKLWFRMSQTAGSGAV